MNESLQTMAHWADNPSSGAPAPCFLAGRFRIGTFLFVCFVFYLVS
jgi:hypothetical protein